MPFKPKRPCSYPGCPRLTEGRFCEKHLQETEKEYNRQRGSAASRGYDSRWRKARAKFLKANPLCRRCEENGKITKGEVVDHIIPHRGDMSLFWDQNNWQSLCTRCHNRKTRMEDQYPVYKF